MTFYPAIVHGPGTDGGYAAEVLGTGVLGQGNSEIAALTNAAEILQDVINDFTETGELLPVPTEPTAEDLVGGRLAMLQALIPAHAA